MSSTSISPDRLAAFQEEEQRRAGVNVADAVSDGIVSNIRALYRDRVYLPPDWTPASHRNGTPLFALPFLARRVVAFISPKPQRSIEHDLRTPWPIALELARAGILIPVVSWPTDYGTQDTGYLAPLFDSTIRTTVSMPARGYKMVDLMGAAQYFDDARADTRLTELAELPSLQHKWAQQFPAALTAPGSVQKRASTELQNNYVDLCIFGYNEFALEALEEPDPVLRAQKLLQSSEMLTYPSLIGLDGRPQYRLRAEVADSPIEPSDPPRRVSLPVMRAILNGIDLNIDELVKSPERYMNAVQRVHESGVAERIELLHDRLIDEVESAKSIEDMQLNATAEDLLDQLNVARQEIKAKEGAIAQRSQNRYEFCAAVGLGGATLIASQFARQFGQISLQYALLGAGGSAIAAAYLKERIPSVRDFMVERAAKRALKKPFAFDIWQIRNRLPAA